MAESGSNDVSWNSHTVYALGLYRKIGHSFGIWPMECHNYFSRIRFSIVLGLFLFMNYNLTHEFVIGCVSVSEAVDFIGLLAANTVSILKISVIRFHEKKLGLIIESAIEDWSLIRSDEYREKMRKYAHFGRFVSLVQLTIAYLAVSLIIVGALPTIRPIAAPTTNNVSFTAVRNFPMSTGCTMTDAGSAFYFAVYLLQCVQLYSVCSCNFGCDSLFFGISMHLSAQYDLLMIDIARLGDDDGEGEIKIRKKFAVLIQRHNHLSGLVNFVEDIFHVIILGQLAAAGLHITLLGIQMLFALRDHFYTMLLYGPTGISLLLLQLLMYSYVGDILSSQSTGMRDAAYSCTWYNFSPSLARDVMFVIVRSNNEFRLTAGKVFRMNIEGFTSIFKTMLSFFSVIKLTIMD